MKNINPKTLDKCLSVLKEMKYMADNKLKMDAKKICEKYHTTQAIPTSSKRIGYFTSTGYGGLWQCKKDRFDPIDARKVLADVYRNQKYKKDIEKNDIDTDHKVCQNIEVVNNKSDIPPYLEDVERYCNERKNNINPLQFITHYDANGWMIGKNKMKDWKAAIRTWEIRNITIHPHKKLSNYSDQEIVDELKRRGYTGLLEINVKKEISF